MPIRDNGREQVLVVLHSVLSDSGVISAAEQLVAGNAVLRYLRVVPRSPAFRPVLSPPLPFGSAAPQPLRIVAPGDDMATAILDLSRELKITLLALGEPPRDRRSPRLIRKVLSRLLTAGSVPILYVPPAAQGPRDDLRRILLVLHAPYPAFDLLEMAIPLARRSHAELLILPLPSAVPIIPDAPSNPFVDRPSLALSPFDPIAWLERECDRRGCRARPVAGKGSPADVIVQQAAALEADLVIAGVGLGDLRVGWWRRRILDLLFPRLSCPLLFSRCA